MIYPENFPQERKNEYAEHKVYDKLRGIAHLYDIFYSKRFVTTGSKSKPEYEIDFILCRPERAILCIEVKGGLVNYDGKNDSWTQNGKEMEKRPDQQVTSSSHSLLNTFKDLIGEIPIGWVLCFPDCQLKDRNKLPMSIKEPQIIDELGLLYCKDSIQAAIDFTKEQYPYKKGIRRWQYAQFKKLLLSDMGFVQAIGTKVKYGNEKFLELTNYQLDLFRRVINNHNIITTGYAGSGKTIVAKSLAEELSNQGKNVLFLCYNRTLANKVRYTFDRNNENLKVSTFHSLAKEIIHTSDSNWWSTNSSSKDEEFWSLDVPSKMSDYVELHKNTFDVLIIDEGQDFKEFWFELLFTLVRPDGYKLIFLDEMQNIFSNYSNVPQRSEFMKYTLAENCRNTKNIVKHLSKIIDKDIKSFAKSPTGDVVINKQVNSENELVKYVESEILSLLKEHQIETHQILILLNSSKQESSLKSTSMLGKYPLAALDNKARFEEGKIHFSNINIFKGLEADIVFVLDTHLIPDNEIPQKLYTEASRAKHKLYIVNRESN